MKEWVTVFNHKGHAIQVLNRAGAGEERGYRIVPAISVANNACPTVGDAINAIDRFGAVSV